MAAMFWRAADTSSPRGASLRYSRYSTTARRYRPASSAFNIQPAQLESRLKVDRAIAARGLLPGLGRQHERGAHREGNQNRPATCGSADQVSCLLRLSKPMGEYRPANRDASLSEGPGGGTPPCVRLPPPSQPSPG